ncbi:MAG: Phage Tail Collar Domain [Proteobacteria bacterium]|nr:Phage Tail Collar Domain [Pseudomonadota bacterium]
MTIASEANRSGPYVCNGATTHFPFSFRIYDETHIRVVLTDPQGIETTLSLGADYAVSGIGQSGGGAIDMAIAYASGYRVTLTLNVPFTQNIDLENQGAYFAETIERALDLQTQQSLQIKEQVARAVVLPVTSTAEIEKLTSAVLSLSEIQPQMQTLAPIAGDITTVAGIAGAIVAAEGNANTATAAAALATGKAAEAAASAAAAQTWNPAIYSTTAQITTTLAGYVPIARKLIAGTGVKLNGGTEASLAGDVTIAVAGVPTGAVMGFDLAAPPIGWIVGDGSAINRAAYSDLDAVKYCGDALNATATAWYRCTDPANPSTTRSVTGGYLVTRDLRGVFLRFLDGGRGLDSGRVLGSQQADMVGPHTHAMSTQLTYAKRISDGGTSNRVEPDYGGTKIDVLSNTGTETRPVNISLLGCIKY